MVRVLDFTEMVVNKDVINEIRELIKNKKEKVVDFSGTVILDYVHEKIAECIVKDGMIPLNIVDSEDRDKIDYFRRQLLQPKVEGLGNFIKVFKKRFKIGDVCVLDKTMSKGLKTNESRRSIIMIEGYDKNDNVKIRSYFSGLVQPKYFREYGGYNSEKLFYRTELDIISLFNGEILVEHPRDIQERKVIDLLFNL